MRLRLRYILMATTLLALVGCSALLSSSPMPQDQPSPAPTSTPPALQTVERAWTVDELLARRSAEQSPIWADGDELTFFYQGEADEVYICCGIQSPMRRIEGTDLWVLTVRIRDLPQSVIGYSFIPYQDGHPVAAEWDTDDSQQWRGPEAPPSPQRAKTLLGRVKKHVIDSVALGERRDLTVYLPPNHDPTQRLPVVYAADGDMVRGFATILDPLIAAGGVPSVIVVGVHSGPHLNDTAESRAFSQARRDAEYMPGVNPERFEAHEQFFVYEVASWAEQNLGAATNREQRAVFGVSNGAVFAIAMGIHHSDHYASVLAFSLAGGKDLSTPQWTDDTSPRHYLVAGTLEEYCRQETAGWAARLTQLGVEHVYRERVCGHDFIIWEEEFPGAVAWAFADR